MKRSSTVAHRSVDALLAGWFAITLVSQHPHRSFDWFRQFDRMGAIPNWRFFAPFPIRYDFVVLFRVVSEGVRSRPGHGSSEVTGGPGVRSYGRRNDATRRLFSPSVAIWFRR